LPVASKSPRGELEVRVPGLLLNVEEEPRDTDLQLTHETRLTWFASDAWRVDLNLVRRYPDENTRSIVNDVMADDAGFSVDYTPQNDFRASARALFSTYSDGNSRVWGQAEFASRVIQGPDLWLGLRATAFDFARVLDNGYWNPDEYQALEASLHFYGKLGERWSYDIQGAAGYGRSNPGDGGFVGSGTARLTYEVGPQAALSLYASHLVSYARTGNEGLLPLGVLETRDEGPFTRTAVGGQLRLRW